MAASDYLYRGNYINENVIEDYRWTLSQPKSFSEIPSVILTQFEVDESTIVTQISYYARAAYKAGTGNQDPLGPYQGLFPKKEPTGRYQFPYFSDVNFEINTPVWQSLDTLGEMGKAVQSGIGTIFGEKVAGYAGQIGSALAGAGMATMAAVYPKVGIMDRPRLWQNHDFRSINIKFPLFNTYDPNDWEKNRRLCWMLINDNLYTKRDFITSIPPVFYEVEIPGQHFSYASCVTNLTVYNRGNMRMLKDSSGKDCVVPDAYEINMTLTDMVMPSKNLFQAVGNSKVVASSSREEQAVNNSLNQPQQ